MIDVKSKITMLGATQIGKTCYMLGMYAQMRDEGINGFTFSTELNKDKYLSDLWDQIVDPETGVDRWPPMTDQPIDYTFNFNYGFKPIMTFDWKDYRGGAIEDDAADTRELVGHMLESAAVLICVSGQHLAEANRTNKVRREARIGNIKNLLAKVGEKATRTGQQLPAAAIVITKYDYCQERPRSEIIEQLKRILPELFSKVGWLTAICPVSLNEGLAGNEKKEGFVIDPDESPELEGLPVPVAFATYSALQDHDRKLQQQKRDRDDEIRRKREQISEEEGDRDELAGGAISRWWNKNRIAAANTRIERAQSEIDAIVQQKALSEENRQQILRNMKVLLGEFLNNFDVPIFYNGEEVELDV